jgi:hypothetical protein
MAEDAGITLVSLELKNGLDQKIERNFVSLKWTLPSVLEPEYLSLAQPCFN